jgi:very-short-patch-repair endonuclease
MTPAETVLWQELRHSQMAKLHFRRQQVIDGFIADFYCHAAGLVVEVDGAIHDAQAEYDAERSQVFARRGIRVLRFANDHVLTDTAGVLAEITAVAGALLSKTKQSRPTP